MIAHVFQVTPSLRVVEAGATVDVPVVADPDATYTLTVGTRLLIDRASDGQLYVIRRVA
ncbi:MAG: hypothetical protein JWM93_2035 [Frankiales bacterium]|nr:hypothetical protein [Frankiales bacterium]